MSRRNKKILGPLILMILAICAALATALVRAGALTTIERSPVESSAVDDPPAEETYEEFELERSEYVERARLDPQSIDALDALGNRLESEGLERLTLAGTLTRTNGSPSGQVQLISEYPGRLRLELQASGQTRVTGFDGEQMWMAGATPDRKEEDLVETLVDDSVEHFFLGQMQGVATRLLGTGFRTDDGEAEEYFGPLYDIYEITEQIKIGQETSERTKHFYFNSNTHLLEKVRYGLERDGIQINVKVEISDWQSVQGQQVPMRIVRIENDTPVLTLTLNSPSVTPRSTDESFANPHN